MSMALIVMGRLGGNPVMRFTPDGTAVTNFSIATDRSYKDAAGVKHKQVTWIRCTVWGNQAESANEWLKKGVGVWVQGELTPDESGNPRIFKRQDGTTGSSYEMRVDRWSFVPASATEPSAEGSDVPMPPEEDEGPDIPF